MRHCFVRIVGRVQGVAFRYYTKIKADKLGLVGTIENRSDGSVVLFVFGDTENVDLFIDWCHLGSPASSVEEVSITELPAMEIRTYDDFSILR